MKRNKIWMVACMVAASVNGLYGCDDDKDFSYNGNLDLNLLGQGFQLQWEFGLELAGTETSSGDMGRKPVQYKECL